MRFQPGHRGASGSLVGRCAAALVSALVVLAMTAAGSGLTLVPLGMDRPAWSHCGQEMCSCAPVEPAVCPLCPGWEDASHKASGIHWELKRSSGVQSAVESTMACLALGFLGGSPGIVVPPIERSGTALFPSIERPDSLSLVPAIPPPRSVA